MGKQVKYSKEPASKDLRMVPMGDRIALRQAHDEYGHPELTKRKTMNDAPVMKTPEEQASMDKVWEAMRANAKTPWYRHPKYAKKP